MLARKIQTQGVKLSLALVLVRAQEPRNVSTIIDLLEAAPKSRGTSDRSPWPVDGGLAPVDRGAAVRPDLEPLHVGELLHRLSAAVRVLRQRSARFAVDVADGYNRDSALALGNAQQFLDLGRSVILDGGQNRTQTMRPGG